MADSEDRSFDWAEYRKDYQPNPSHLDREAIAFFVPDGMRPTPAPNNLRVICDLTELLDPEHSDA